MSARVTPPDELFPVTELALVLSDDDRARAFVDALRATATVDDEAVA